MRTLPFARTSSLSMLTTLSWLLRRTTMDGGLAIARTRPMRTVQQRFVYLFIYSKFL